MKTKALVYTDGKLIEFSVIQSDIILYSLGKEFWFKLVRKCIYIAKIRYLFIAVAFQKVNVTIDINILIMQVLLTNISWESRILLLLLFHLLKYTWVQSTNIKRLPAYKMAGKNFNI